MRIYQWRQIVTIEDALKGGCTLFDIEQLKRENSADDFKNLFMCEFVDDKASVFPFEELQRCMVDTLEEWEDYAPFAANPFGSARYGLVTTRHTVATVPDAWYWHRRWW